MITQFDASPYIAQDVGKCQLTGRLQGVFKALQPPLKLRGCLGDPGQNIRGRDVSKAGQPGGVKQRVLPLSQHRGWDQVRSGGKTSVFDLFTYLAGPCCTS